MDCKKKHAPIYSEPLKPNQKRERGLKCSCGEFSAYGYDKQTGPAFMEHKRQAK
ncbi:hypothetical protein CMP1-69 [Clavibacter phage CMP1]|uniref:Uncharacterized protein n=1 Tax=Clavibacter phage CMP1 TaxID=686439 RepID=D0U253_9CAUD|nr:hypothetical protein CMP1-69 [Clavibacter phage CMP1]ACY35961.1 hypothetical protein CMP1-69 [Clavibacter phage CMP1]